MASYSDAHDACDTDKEDVAVELPPTDMAYEKVFIIVLCNPAKVAAKTQCKRIFFKKSTPRYSISHIPLQIGMLSWKSGTKKIWENRNAVDIIVKDSYGVNWGAHKAVITPNSRALERYVFTGKTQLEYTKTGKVKLTVNSVESFAIDALLQYEYFGRYILKGAASLSLAEKVPLNVKKLRIVPNSDVLRGHLAIHHLAELLENDSLADESFGHIQWVLAQKTVSLDDFIVFIHELFHSNGKYNTV
ncbi:uncharacterized protein K460DRAFT_406155 [Cucurbitaria berberidis CBS 394.84]|uniref:BTB domain-containing protein n=1 Tax=Cucurbitaria berberidis CBS 394.84 TaxID=1168544 RepID=A0A9P4GHY5_9PLEO|nr:uncharacterized protein K460DRAFT_406155 [Cucurbitaria berberidis CBS 394.84]KAF1845925.1 hypothetical protein K460DRAFT_406155 [Cucurbitaria berberidis CBS 394.84]